MILTCHQDKLERLEPQAPAEYLLIVHVPSRGECCLGRHNSGPLQQRRHYHRDGLLYRIDACRNQGIRQEASQSDMDGLLSHLQLISTISLAPYTSTHPPSDVER